MTHYCLQPEEEVDPKLKSAQQKAGMTVSRSAYFIIKEGLPYSKLPNLLLLNNLNLAKLGNINHSRDFMNRFTLSAKEALREKVLHYLSTPLDKTGENVPCSISDDLATYQKETRQFVTVLVPVPNSEILIRAIPLSSAPVSSDGRSGQKIAETIYETIEDYRISPNQVVSTCFDGAYIHETVGPKLVTLLGVEPSKVQNCYDAMHKGNIQFYNTHSIFCFLFFLNFPRRRGGGLRVKIPCCAPAFLPFKLNEYYESIFNE